MTGTSTVLAAFSRSIRYADDAESSAYLMLLENAAKTVDVPVIGSLNGATMGGWISFARQMQDAGASALELNVYYVPGDLRIPSEEVENLHLEVLVGVKDAVSCLLYTSDAADEED